MTTQTIKSVREELENESQGLPLPSIKGKLEGFNLGVYHAHKEFLDKLELIDDIAYDGIHGVIQDYDALEGIRDKIKELKQALEVKEDCDCKMQIGGSGKLCHKCERCVKELEE